MRRQIGGTHEKPTQWLGILLTGATSFPRKRAESLINVPIAINVFTASEIAVWSVTAWSKNLFDKIYNAEWAPGPPFPGPAGTNNFVFRAQPRVWGVGFKYHF